MIPLDGTRLPSKEEIGGKAWSIARMSQLGLPVPPAVVLPVSDCRTYQEHGLTPELERSARDGVALIEQATGRTFGSGPRPLLLSVRSGAAVSMPGMMDTVLDLGINAEVEAALAAESGDEAYARDTHRRFTEIYRRVILRDEFDERPIPTDPWEQLRAAVCAVFSSWNSRRAKAYRRHWGIPEEGGTAVTLQAMVFGNLDDRSGTGVLFTRNPLSGANEPYGEYLPRGQGEDVVSGEHDPLPIAQMDPAVLAELVGAGRRLEREAADAQDVEFTVERGRLFLLQTRTAKRSPTAAVRIAADLVAEGLIAPEEAVRRVTAAQVRTLLRPRIPDEVRAGATVVARGTPACPGVAAGVAVPDPDEAEARGAAEDVVLVRATTSPEDVPGMIAATGVCTEAGGSTSHAAVVSRALGRPCVVGCGAGVVDRLTGEPVTLDGETGEVFAGLLPLEEASVSDDPALAQLAGLAAAAASPIRAVPPEHAPADAVDLDAAAVVDPAEVREAVRGATAARGQVLESDDGVAAAVAAGVTTLVVRHPLPALLAAISENRGR